MNLGQLLGQLKRVRRSGSGWSTACPAHLDRCNSFSVHVRDGRALLYCHAGCEFRDILQALSISATDLQFENAEVPVRSREERLRLARRLWEKSQPATGTLVEKYLGARGITAPIPQAIRSTALLMHRDFGWPFPAMSAGVQDAAGKFAGVAVTWLSADGTDKAPVEMPRRIFGPVRGGAVRLAQAGEMLAIAEGIETALSVQQAADIPAWTTIGATNLPHVELPKCVREIIICADADPAGESAAQSAAHKFLREGRRVRIAHPHGGKDFNDMRL
jgi:putative DNA primase/helicase